MKTIQKLTLGLLALTSIPAIAMETSKLEVPKPQFFGNYLIALCKFLQQNPPTDHYGRAVRQECEPVMKALQETNNQLKTAEQRKQYEIVTMLYALRANYRAIEYFGFKHPSLLRPFAIDEKKYKNHLTELGRPDLINEEPMIKEFYNDAQSHCNLVANTPNGILETFSDYAIPYAKRCTPFFNAVNKAVVEDKKDHNAVSSLTNALESRANDALIVSLLADIVAIDTDIRAYTHQGNHREAEKAAQEKANLIIKLKATGYTNNEAKSQGWFDWLFNSK